MAGRVGLDPPEPFGAIAPTNPFDHASHRGLMTFDTSLRVALSPGLIACSEPFFMLYNAVMTVRPLRDLDNRPRFEIEPATWRDFKAVVRHIRKRFAARELKKIDGPGGAVSILQSDEKTFRVEWSDMESMEIIAETQQASEFMTRMIEDLKTLAPQNQ